MVLSGYLSCPPISVFPRSLSSFAGPLYAVLLLENQLWYRAVLQAPPGLTFEFQSFSLHPTALQLVASDFKAAKNLVFGQLLETKNNKKQPLQRPCPLSESNRGSSHNARLLRVLKWIRPCFLIERITILTDAVPLSHCYLLVWCEKYAQKVHSQRAILWMQKFYLYYILLFLLWPARISKWDFKPTPRPQPSGSPSCNTGSILLLV